MNQDKIWDVYQNDPELRDMGCRDGGRISFIKRFVPDDSRVLNIGIGRGTLETVLSKRNVDVHCLDPSERSVAGLRDALELDGKARVGYSQNIPFETGYFDCVVMTEVLEHLSDEVLDQTRGEVHRVLKNEGVFLGSVPADESLIESMVVCPECGKKFHRWGHLQSFSQSYLEEYLRMAFSNVEVRRESFADWSELNWKGKLFAVAKKAQARAGRPGQNQSFFFLARKAV